MSVGIFDLKSAGSRNNVETAQQLSNKVRELHNMLAGVFGVIVEGVSTKTNTKTSGNDMRFTPARDTDALEAAASTFSYSKV